MHRAVSCSIGFAFGLLGAACGAGSADGSNNTDGVGAAAGFAEDDTAVEDPAAGNAVEAARAAGLQFEEFEGVQFFWHAPDGYNQALLLPARPAIVNGCLAIGQSVIVWYSTDISAARNLITALRAGEPVDAMSLGGGAAQPPSPFVSPIRERCGAELIWVAGPLDD